MGSDDMVEADGTLPPHPATEIVTLSNGFTSWIRPHPRPVGSIAMSLHVQTGSLNEEETEYGVSHFLEHMAFEGGAHFPAGRLTAFLDSLGLRIGQHCNAYTGRESTSYTLSVPNNSPETIDSCLACFADFAYGMSLLPEAVDRERRVVLEEMRQHRKPSSRIRGEILRHLLPDSDISRSILGTEEAVRNMTVEQLRSYYDRCYRPDNTILLITGDIDPGRVEPSLRRFFGGWNPLAPRSVSPALPIQALTSPRVAVIEDLGKKEVELRFVSLRPSIRLQTVDHLRDLLAVELGFWLVNQRLGALLREGQAAFDGMRLGVAPLVKAWSIAGAMVLGLPDRWQPMLTTLTHEMKRALRHGFPAPEVGRARAHVLARARQSQHDEESSNSDAILARMTASVAAGRPPMSDAQKLKLFEVLAPAIESDDLLAAFAESFDPSRRLIVAVTPARSNHRMPTPEELFESWQRQEAQPVSAPSIRIVHDRLMTSPPIAGTVEEQHRTMDLDLLSVTFGNGVRAHLRTMDYSKNRVFVDLILAGGRLRERAENVGVTTAAALAFSQPATADLSSVQIRDILAAKGVSFARSVEEDLVRLRIWGDPGDLEYGLQLVHLLLTQPRLEASAVKRWQRQIAERNENMKVSMQAQIATESLKLLTGDDCRFQLISAKQAQSMTRDRAQNWLQTDVCRAPIEVAIVGDLDRDRALALAARYFGSLPSRLVDASTLEPLRQLNPRRGPLCSALEIETTDPRSAVLMGWRAAPWQEITDRHLLQMAAQILRQRLLQELRERRGMTYSLNCSLSPSKAYPQASMLSLAVDIPPERVAEALSTIEETVHSFAKSGPGEEEMEAARKQLIELFARAEREPVFWSRVLSEADYRRLSPSEIQHMSQRFLTYSRRQLRVAFERYTTEDRHLKVTCQSVIRD